MTAPYSWCWPTLSPPSPHPPPPPLPLMALWYRDLEYLQVLVLANPTIPPPPPTPPLDGPVVWICLQSWRSGISPSSGVGQPYRPPPLHTHPPTPSPPLNGLVVWTLPPEQEILNISKFWCCPAVVCGILFCFNGNGWQQTSKITFL